MLIFYPFIRYFRRGKTLRSQLKYFIMGHQVMIRTSMHRHELDNSQIRIVWDNDGKRRLRKCKTTNNIKVKANFYTNTQEKCVIFSMSLTL
jgi:hypothetical protein